MQAWGVNFPAHLVVVKGTEFYDAKTKGYKDFPITDVLQMMGRAGRPQFDDSGVAVVLVHDIKKNFYKKFLHQPFPVESSMHLCLEEHLNAEIASGTIATKQDAMDWVTWTYLYRRVFMNPSFYGCDDYDEKSVNIFLSRLIDDALGRLVEGACIIEDEVNNVASTPYGKISSHYYLKYTTMKTFKNRLVAGYNSEEHFSNLLRIMCDAQEFAELPVRHNEDLLNQEFEMQLPVPLSQNPRTLSGFDDPKAGYSYGSPHSKAFLLLQAHLCRIYTLPVSDYVTDTNTVLDQTIRILQAMIDVSVFKGHLHLARGIISLMQCLKQACWINQSCLLCLPHITEAMLVPLQSSQNSELFSKICVSLFPLVNLYPSKRGLYDWFQTQFKDLGAEQIKSIVQVVEGLPFCALQVTIASAADQAVKCKQGRWFVQAGKEYKIKVTASLLQKEAAATSMYAPRFHKLQIEGWFLLLGEERKNVLHACKRLSPPEQIAKTKGGKAGTKRPGVYLSTVISHTFKKDVGAGDADVDFNIYLDSDGYRGLDVVHILRTTVTG